MNRKSLIQLALQIKIGFEENRDMSDSINELHSHVKMPLEVLREMLAEEPNHEFRHKK